VSGATAGDDSLVGQSFEALALPHLEAVARFARSLTRGGAEADDLVQETYLNALRYWKTFVPGHDPRVWLFAICRNEFVHLRRAQGRIIESDEEDLDAMPAVLGHIEAWREGLGALFDQIDVRPAIERAVDTLPEPHRSVLVIVDVEGRTYDEAATILDVPIGTVRSRLFRARRAIQGALIAHARDAGIGLRRSTESEG
jgi:RNA polymerase sigma-70 factor, ECF subfamily